MAERRRPSAAAPGRHDREPGGHPLDCGDPEGFVPDGGEDEEVGAGVVRLDEGVRHVPRKRDAAWGKTLEQALEAEAVRAPPQRSQGPGRILLLQAGRVARRALWSGVPPRDAAAYGSFCGLGKFAQLLGLGAYRMGPQGRRAILGIVHPRVGA